MLHHHITLYLQAIEAYQGAVRVDGAHQTAALALAKLHLDKGEEEAGRAVCAQLLTVQPDNTEAQLLMVQLLSTQVRLVAMMMQSYTMHLYMMQLYMTAVLHDAIIHDCCHALPTRQCKLGPGVLY